ncbi:MAG: hypothetical protein IPM33_09995 [Phycisphaerales bacterium]|nr:hypothetical protein [Phycisphaerales bacterium]
MTKDNSPHPGTDCEARLRALLGVAAQQMARIEEIASGLDALIDQDAPEALLAALDDRQAIINDLLAQAPALEEAINAWKAQPHPRDAMLDDQLRSLASAIEAMASSGATAQRRCEVARDAALSELTGLARAVVATKAYGAEPPQGPRFQDMEG